MKYSKILNRFFLLLFIILNFLLNTVSSKANTSDIEYIHTFHRNLYDANNDLIKLRGFNLGGWLLWESWLWSIYTNPQESLLKKLLSDILGIKTTQYFEEKVYENFITEKDIELISSSGFNCVRIPFNHRLFDEERYQYSSKNWKLLDSVLTWCKKYGVYAVLDMHSTPGGQSKEWHADKDLDSTKFLWSSETSKIETINLWKRIARRYSSNEIIAGYDVINEPVAPKGEELFKLYQRIIKSIREVDQNHVIFLEANYFGTDFSSFKKLSDDNIALSCHMYTGPNDDIEAGAKKYDVVSVQLDMPIWVGEWGENNYDVIEKTLHIFEKEVNFCGWALWTWKRTPYGTPPQPRYVPLTIKLTPGMKQIIDRIEGRLQTFPQNFDISSALNEFIMQFDPSNCSFDKKLIAILSKYR